MQKFSVDNALTKANSLIKQGHIDEAKNMYQTILSNYPKNLRALKALQAIMSAKNNTKSHQSAEQSINKLINFYNQGQFIDLISEAEYLLKVNPESYMIWNIKGAAQRALGHIDEALESFKQVVSLNPNYPEGLNNLGTILKDQGKFDEALDVYNQALIIKPDYTDCHYNMGIIFKEQGKFDEAVRAYNQALKINPRYAEAYNNKAVILKEQGDLDQALDNYEKALSINPKFYQALLNKSIVLRLQGKIDDAIDSYKKVLTLKPDTPEAFNDLGIISIEQGDLNEALAMFQKALTLKPDFAEVYNNIGNVKIEQNDLNEALAMFQKALTISPYQHDPFNNIANIYQLQGKRRESIEACNKALAIKPDFEMARSKKLYQQARLCDWDGIVNDRDHIPLLGTTKQSIDPFTLLALEDAPERHRKRSELFANDKLKQSPLPFDVKFISGSKPIRIGYFSADFKEHVVSRLIAPIIERHNRNDFEVYGYSIKQTQEDHLKKRLVQSFDVFRDVSQINDKQVAQLAREDKIDIAIDLNGYTQNARVKIFVYRAAPIQISYLGYPGTMGTNFMDYIIADHKLIPETSQLFYSEKPIYLPNTYMPGDNTCKIPAQSMSREELGLPEDAFVFCVINNSYKITPQIFDIWTRLLKKVKGSVLWLLSPDDDVKLNLIKEASARGISADRLVFVNVKPYDQYIAQFSKADLFLDTFTYNAGATANHALWAGLPIVTKSGKSYTSRMATSMLDAVGLSELVTTTEKEYEELIINLATNPDKLYEIRERLSKNRLSEPLFDTELYIKHLEEGYRTVYENYIKGNKPQIINVN